MILNALVSKASKALHPTLSNLCNIGRGKVAQTIVLAHSLSKASGRKNSPQREKPRSPWSGTIGRIADRNQCRQRGRQTTSEAGAGRSAEPSRACQGGAKAAYDHLAVAVVCGLAGSEIPGQ